MDTIWAKWSHHVLHCTFCASAYRINPGNPRFLEHTCPEGTALYRVWQRLFYFSY